MCTFLISAVLLLGSVVHGSADAKLAAAKLEARYRTARVLQATFMERYSENGHAVRVEAGTAYFRRPGKMRWEYESPERNLFLVDGKTAWFYVPADHTVTKVPAKQSTDWRTPIALLAGEMKLSRVCARVELATDAQPEQPNDILLDCALRGQQGSVAAPRRTQRYQAPDRQDKVLLEIAPETGDLVRVRVQDIGGVAVEFRFANWQFDPAVPESLFRFEVPPGVAIVNGEVHLPMESSQ